MERWTTWYTRADILCVRGLVSFSTFIVSRRRRRRRRGDAHIHIRTVCFLFTRLRKQIIVTFLFSVSFCTFVSLFFIEEKKKRRSFFRSFVQRIVFFHWNWNTFEQTFVRSFVILFSVNKRLRLSSDRETRKRRRWRRTTTTSTTESESERKERTKFRIEGWW